MKLFKTIYWFFTGKIERIQRLIYWMPIVWRTGDWDSGHALYFFMLKLRKVRNTIDTNRRHTGDSKRVRRMWEFEQILKRILGENNNLDYDFQYYKDADEFELKLGEADEYDLREVIITLPNLKECCMLKEGLQMLEHSKMLKSQDWDLFCEYMKKYYEGWWD